MNNLIRNPLDVNDDVRYGAIPPQPLMEEPVSKINVNCCRQHYGTFYTLHVLDVLYLQP